MKSLLIMVALLVAMTMGAYAQISSQVLKVAVFYDSYDLPSYKFITQELYPAYRKIGKSLLIDFVPYGNTTRSQVNGTWKYHCPNHDIFECMMNKYQACCFARVINRKKQMEFVNCVEDMIINDGILWMHRCTTKISVDAEEGDEIARCSNWPEGDKLYEQYADKQEQLDPPLSHVPWIVFNDKYDADLESAAVNNFLDTACKLLDMTPEGCR